MAKDFADISRIETAEEMNATNKRGSVSKLMKAWESKNAKRAMQGAGLTTMAVTLAACGGSDDTTTTTPVAPPAPVPVNAVLTVGVDVVTGTEVGDTFSGARNDTLQTWNSGDSISAGLGDDTLTATISADVTPGSGAITGVNNLVVTVLGTNSTVTFSTTTVTGISGVDTITNIGSTADLTLTRVVDLAAITINNTGANATTVTFADAVLAGAADVLTLSLIGAGAGAISIGSTLDIDGDYETLVVNASGAASDLAGSANSFGADATTVTVNATANLDFGTTARFAKVNDFSAAGSSADVTVVFADKATTGSTAFNATGGAGDDTLDLSNIVAADVGTVTVNGGAGDDTITVGFLEATMTVNGGAGTDTLVYNTTINPDVAGGVTGFEALHTNANQTMTDFVNNAGILTFRVLDAGAVLSNVASGAAALQLTTAASVVELARLVDTSSDSITITMRAGITGNSTVTVSDEETVTIVNRVGNTDFGTGSLIAADMTSLTVVGDELVDLTTVTAAKLATVDLTGMAGDADADFVANMGSSLVAMTVTTNTATSHLGSINVTTGIGADNVTGTANADSITTGNGNDTIRGGDGDDTIDTGAGTDRVIFEASASANNYDTVTFTAGTGGDVLDFSAFLGAGTVSGVAGVAFAEFTSSNNDDFEISGKVVLFDHAGAITDGADAGSDVAAEVAAAIWAEIDGADDAFNVAAGGKAVIISGTAADATTDKIHVTFVHDSDGDGLEESEVVTVMISGANMDLDTLVAANIDVVA